MIVCLIIFKGELYIISTSLYIKLFNIETLNKVPVKILKFGTPQTIAIIVLKIEKFDVTLH